jgi:hypothetical protein
MPASGPFNSLLPTDGAAKAKAQRALVALSKAIQTVFNLEDLTGAMSGELMTLPIDVVVEELKKKRAVVIKEKLDILLPPARASLHKVRTPGIPLPPTHPTPPTDGDTGLLKAKLDKLFQKTTPSEGKARTTIQMGSKAKLDEPFQKTPPSNGQARTTIQMGSNKKGRGN